MPAQTRDQILTAQEELWTDDEIRWHLHRMLIKADPALKVVLDPLIATAVVNTGQVGLLYQWYRQFKVNPTTIATAIMHAGHWTPVVWTWTPESATAHSWDVQGPNPRFNVLHDAIAKLVGARTYITHVAHRQFAFDRFCGVCTVRWLDYFLNGKMLPTTQEEAEHLQIVGKTKFQEHLQSVDFVPRPWIWGAGLAPHVQARFQDLLKQHGVPDSQVEARTHLATQAIGVGPLQGAVTSSSPWRNIKALANQVRPPMQLVLPQELEAVLQQKTKDGTVSTRKKQKQQQINKASPKLPPLLDVSKLTLDTGKFVDEKDEPLQQISVTSLGPASTGVALANLHDVEQFLKNGIVVAPGPLAIFLVNVAQIQTDLQWAQCRISLRCAANGEPMLVHGFLIQIGSSIVRQADTKHSVDLCDVQATCVKVTVYRDNFPQDWSVLQKAPVKTVLSLLTPLQVCDSKTENCTCEKWHGEFGFDIKDPVFDVWRRQWLNLAFNAVNPSVADIFAVNVRCVKSVEMALLAASGVNGLYVEPRSVDGKQAIPDFRIIWLPRATPSEIQHIRQTVPAVLGIARLGSRLGVRTRASDASTVSSAIKPDAIVLAAGARQSYEIGPIPFGMDRSAVATLCSGWGWQVKPLNPVRSAEGLGMIWLVQACVEPSSNIFQTKKGEIVINFVPSKQSSNQPLHSVVYHFQCTSLSQRRSPCPK